MRSLLLPLVPDLKRRLWGGDRLPALVGAAAPPGDEPVAEAWLAHGDSVVASGPDRGARLADLVRERGEALVGTAATERYGRTMPLLVKVLDARRELSVQVHPDDAYAARRHAGSGHLGKTESWRILAAEPGASVSWGFRRPVREAEVREAIARGELPRLLREVEVTEGDVIHNPAGTVHAIGGGILLYELQQASDLTYRLWDHGRVGADGRPRELHLDDGLAVADLSGRGDPRPEGVEEGDTWRTRVVCPQYVMDEAAILGDATCRTGPEAMHVLTVLEGEVDVHAGEERATLHRTGTAVVAAETGPYRLAGEGLVVRGRPAVANRGAGEGR